MVFTFIIPRPSGCDSCAERGELFPSWNPHEGLGVSVAGQTTSAVYYPLRAVWLLPTLSLGQRYALFLFLHAALAGLGMLYAASRLGLSTTAGWLAAIAYALSCPVIFQHSNLIYLTSAAWVGFALGAMLDLRASRRPTWRHCGVFAIACSMILLAGDPHTAVNSCILACGLALVSHGLRLMPAWRSSTARWTAARELLAPWRWLLVAGMLTVAATAVQWIPSMRWSAHSSRFAARHPMLTSDNPQLQQILAASSATPHRIYDFSLPPWHLLSTIWPTLGGHYLPHHARWVDAIPSEGRMWIPSLYFGMIPCLCILGALQRLRTTAPVCQPWLLGLSCVALLLAFGNYSLLWLMRQCLEGMGCTALVKQLPADHVGSFYWMLTQLVPNYEGFRYPGKWITWFVAPACLWAACQFDQPSESCLEIFKRGSLRNGIMYLSLGGLCISLGLWFAAANGMTGSMDAWFAQAANDRLLGSPTALAVARSCSLAFALPLCILWLVGYLSQSVSAASLRQAMPWLTLIEMTCVAWQWMVFADPPHTIRPSLPKPESRFVWANPRADTANLGKLPLLEFERVFNPTQSIEPAEVERIRFWLSGHDRLTARQPQLDQVLAALGVTHRNILDSSPDAGRPTSLQTVEDAAELCQLTDHNLQPASGQVDWQWNQSGELELMINCSHASQLTIRQYADGGWIAETWDATHRYPLRMGRLFIELSLPAGKSHLRLRRKWLY